MSEELEGAALAQARPVVGAASPTRGGGSTPRDPFSGRTRSIDSRELRPVLVPAPVGAGQRHELHRPDWARVLEVRPTAEVDEVALLVERGVALRPVDELDLVGLALVGEVRFASSRLVSHRSQERPSASSSRIASSSFSGPPRPPARGTRSRSRSRSRSAGRWPPSSRIEPPRGLGEQVRGRVAQHPQRVGILPVARREEVDLLAVDERQPQVADAPVRAHEHCLLGELRPDRAGGVQPRRAVGKFEVLAVGKDDPHGDREYSAPG